MPLSFSSFYAQTCLSRHFDDAVFPPLQLYEDYMATNAAAAAADNGGDAVRVELVAVAAMTTDPAAEAVYRLVYGEPFMQFFLNDRNVAKDNSFATEMWSTMKNLSADSVIHNSIHGEPLVPANFMVEKMDELRQLLADTRGFH